MQHIYISKYIYIFLNIQIFHFPIATLTVMDGAVVHEQKHFHASLTLTVDCSHKS